MSEYCVVCGSIYNEVIHNFNLFMHCEKCGYRTQATPEDTLRYTEDFSSSSEFPSIDWIVNNPVHRIVNIDCKCGGKLGKMRSFGDDVKIITVCEACGKQVL